MRKYSNNLRYRLALWFAPSFVIFILLYIVLLVEDLLALPAFILLVVVSTLVWAGAWLGVNAWLIHPIHQIVGMAQQLEQGNLTARVDTGQMRGDIAEIAASFNEIAEDLACRDSQLNNSRGQVRKQSLQVASLLQIGRRIDNRLELERVLETICEEVIHALKISACSIRLYQPERETFELVTQCGLPEAIVRRATQLDLRVYNLHTLEEDTLVHFHEPDESPRLPDDLNENKVRGEFFSIKMMQGDLPIGLLTLYNFPENDTSELSDPSFLSNVADEASLAITNAILYENLQQEQNKKLGLIQRLISVQEEERIHIARELHDVTSQNLSAMRVLLDTITLTMDEPNAQALAYIQSIRKIIDTLLSDTRRMISDLRPIMLDDLGLNAAISWYADERLGPAGINYHFEHQNQACRFSPTIETTLFRILQEAITNIVSHAKASMVDIYLYQEKNSVILIVSDNGQGFDPSILHTQPGKCYGLTGIEERVNTLEGKYQISSTSETGTTLEIILPLS